MMIVQVIETIRYGWATFEKYPRRCWLGSVLFLGGLGLMAFFWQLGQTGLVDETEPLFAEAARQMVVTGDWVTPYFNHATRFDKPPLIYWLMAIAFRWWGVNEWSVRLPSAVAAFGLMGLLFVTLQRFGDASGGIPSATLTLDHPPESAVMRRRQRQRWLSAWLGGAMVASNLQVIVWARQGVSDMLLCGCIGAALLCFFWGYAHGVPSRDPPRPQRQLWRPGNRWYGVFFVFCALGILTKGPIGVVLPGLAIVLFLLWVGQLRAVLWEIGLLGGMGLMGAIAVPWFVLVIQRHGNDYIATFFGYHNFERFTDVVNSHSAPWYFYFMILLLGFFPWSIYLPLAIARLRFWQRSHWQAQPREQQLGLFALAWFISVFGFFSLAVTKLPSYILPLIPAAAILVALLGSEQFSAIARQPDDNRWSPAEARYRGWVISTVGNIALATMLAIALGMSPEWLAKDPSIEALPRWLQQWGLPWRGALIWLLSAVGLGWCLRYRGLIRWTLLINLVSFVCFIGCWIMPTLTLLDQARQLPLRQIATEIIQVRQPDEGIIMVGFPKPSLVFYSQQSVQFYKIHQVIRNPQSIVQRLDAWIQANPTSKTTLLVSRADDLVRINLPTQEMTLLAAHGRFQLIRLPNATLLGRVNQLADSP